MPNWLYQSNRTDRLFWDELTKTIKASGRYNAMPINLPNLSIPNTRSAQHFCEKNNLAIILQHDSPFFSANIRYMRTFSLLDESLPMMNTYAAHQIGHNKILTKKLLRSRGVAVLDDAVISSVEELRAHLHDGAWYVVKPADKGAGAGVKLIKSERGGLLQYRNGKWRPITMRTKKVGTVTLEHRWGLQSSFTYGPMLVEPYFGDDAAGFSSLRCTVVGNEVVEAVKRTNRKNITSNVSCGGTAIRAELTSEQKEMALAATKFIGADYAGVDLLVCGGKSVICEINIGPFTVFSAYTGAQVGRALAEYAMQKCDENGAHICIGEKS